MAFRFPSPEVFDAPDWAIDDLVGNCLNLLVADGGSGKTTVALEMVRTINAGESEYLGHKVNIAGLCGFITSEDNGYTDLSKRHLNAGGDSQGLAIWEYEKWDLSDWELVAKEADDLGVRFLVFDNLQAAIGGDGTVNSDEDQGRILDGLRAFRRIHSIPVLLLHHTATTSGNFGAGSKAVRNGARHVVLLTGKVGKPQKLIVSKTNADNSYHGPLNLSVGTMADLQEAEAEKQAKRVRGQSAREAKNAERKAFWVENCEGKMTARAAAKIMAVKFDVSAETARGWIKGYN